MNVCIFLDILGGMVKDCFFEEIIFELIFEWVEEIIYEKIWGRRVLGIGNIKFKSFKVGIVWEGIVKKIMYWRYVERSNEW